METRGLKSLAFLAQKACIKYLKRISDIGECPYELIRPVLLKLENPDQLHQLEINSPQIIGHDGEIWLQFIKRDIPDWESKHYRPKDPKNWWKIYKKLKEQTQKDREQGAEKLKAAMNSIKDEREQNRAKVVSRKDLPKEPANHKARNLWNYNSGKTGSKSGHKLSLLEKIRKEAREARLARVNQPTSQAVTRPTEVKKAPQGLVEEYKRSAQQRTSPLITEKPPKSSRTPRPPLAVNRQEKPSIDEALQEREERLRTLTAGGLDVTTNVPDPRAKSTNPHRKAPSALRSPSRVSQQLLQTDGASDEALEKPQIPDPLPGSRNQTRDTVTSPPKRRTGTPPLSRFGSPGPPPKRKAEPSIFMNTKKPRLAR